MLIFRLHAMLLLLVGCSFSQPSRWLFTALHPLAASSLPSSSLTLSPKLVALTTVSLPSIPPHPPCQQIKCEDKSIRPFHRTILLWYCPLFLFFIVLSPSAVALQHSMQATTVAKMHRASAAMDCTPKGWGGGVGSLSLTLEGGGSTCLDI